eukprot:PhM_4_TR11715/c0_g1_i1/m.29616
MDLATESATKIQCLWRCICARRRVSTIRLNRWLRNRNSTKIQCLVRRVLAKMRVKRLLDDRAKHRADRVAAISASRIHNVTELMLWSTTKCEAAAVLVQRWFRGMRTRERTVDIVLKARRLALAQREEADRKAAEESRLLAIEMEEALARVPAPPTPVPMGDDEEPVYGTVVAACSAPPATGEYVRNHRLAARDARDKMVLENTLLMDGAK